jgi:uncharacterized membrane protein
VDYSHFKGKTYNLGRLLAGMDPLATDTSSAVIQIGLFILVLLQSVRVILCIWIFGRTYERLYVAMSAFLLIILLGSFV